MVKLTTFLLLSLLLIVTTLAQNADNRKLIKGTWQGSFDTLKVTLIVKDNTGEVLGMPSGNHYSFKYSFKNDSIIRIVVGSKMEFHKIRKLSKDRFRLIPYPHKIHEAIDLIDVIDFKRSSH